MMRLTLKKNKADNIEHLVGVAKSFVVNVNHPSVGTPKGRRKLRIKGGKEKAIEKSLKNMNVCSLCGSLITTRGGALRGYAFTLSKAMPSLFRSLSGRLCQPKSKPAA
ncbi:hypothetical protein Tco_1073314 [Tanacetum coccineum]